MVIALIAGLRPGTSPPPVRIAMVLLLAITKKVAEAGLVHQRGLLTGLGRQLLLQNWRHPRPQQLDCFHQLRVRQRTGIHLKSDARNSAQRLAVPDDLLRNLVGITNQQRTFWTALRIETGAGDRRPAALPADIGEGAGVAGKEFIRGLLRCRRDITQRVDTDFQTIGRMPESLTSLPIQVDQRTKTVRVPTDDRDHQRKSERAGTRKGLRCSTDSEPYRQWILERTRINALSRQGRSMFARPGHILIVADLEEQLQLLGEQRIVVLQ